ncbi:FAD-dependent oxidoreductase [bacterium]|nr:FAD-dependent oxidoreductase [bacterium]
MTKTKPASKKGSVMVVGAGVAGIQASLDLAASGYYVHLVDKSPSIGGLMAQLDKTFPTNDCAMCILSPFLVEVGRHININIIPNSEVESLEGEPGCFTAHLSNTPRFIDPVKCTGCGQCRMACPVTAVNEFDCGLDERRASYIKYPQAVPLAYQIDRNICIGCGMCEKVCLAKAVKFDDKPLNITLEVGAVILAPGNETFDPAGLDSYHYTDHPNVVTSIEFERILSASGPYKGHLMRPSDRKEPAKIAWLQCIGSRDINRCDNSYCSSVCCMYSIKEAVIAMEHAHNSLDTAIFYMDMRTHGKEFEQTYKKAKDQHGVRFVRSRIHSVDPIENGDLRISYLNSEGQVDQEIFDMVILSVGFQVDQNVIKMAQRLGVELNSHQFARTNSFDPVSTSKPGIYVCGTFQGPKDIPQSVVEASAAAGASGILLGDSRWQETKTVEIPPELNVIGERPNIGVFLCQCGINIGGVVNIPEVREYAKSLPYVVHVEDNLYTCSQDTQVNISQVIKEKGINRVIVAACTPKTHEPMFQETLVASGLNKYLFEMCNIRNQNSWVHMNDPQKATEKAKDLVRMAVAKAGLLEPLSEKELLLNKNTLVVGGGISGLVAAKTLANQNYEVCLVEQNEKLGGQALSLNHTWRNENISTYLEELIEEVIHHPKIQVHTTSKLGNVDGFVGSFKTDIQGENGSTSNYEHGATIIATGASEYKPSEYLYGEDERVMTLLELSRKTRDSPDLAKEIGSVVFIQCVGSREKERPYCSRVCCTHTVKSALNFKKQNPKLSVYVLNRDIRTYGEREDLYSEAREAGVIFVKYDLESKPQVVVNGDSLMVTIFDNILNRYLSITTDLLVLATAIVAPNNDQLAQFFKIPINEDGFFVEAHVKLRPVDFPTDGVFLCGMAHYPKSVDESIAQAMAAASRVTGLLSADKIYSSGVVASINPVNCSGCGICVSICPYSAPFKIEEGRFVGKAEINSILCKGCGLCAAACRSGAANLRGFEQAQVMAMLDEI